MEFRVLQYFLAVAREETILGAAESLHLSQPTLSRQLKELEDELGKQLMIRGNRKITLTEEGMLLRRRAQEIVDLTAKTKSEIKASDDCISGDIHIGGGETEGMRIIARTVKSLQMSHPQIRIHLFSGNADDVTERLDKGLLDFGLLIEPVDISRYDFIRLPASDVWGILTRKDNPLAAYQTIKPEYLPEVPLIGSRRNMVRNELSGWLGGEYDRLNVVATYNLIFNASIMVEEGVGSAFSIDKLVKIPENSQLCFRPLEPRLEARINVVWKKHHIFSKAVEKFLEQLKSV
jgi:DNA-binding transcriptional LysR family regulator